MMNVTKILWLAVALATWIAAAARGAEQNFGQIKLNNSDIGYNDVTRVVDLYKLLLNTNAANSLVVEKADGTDVLVVDTTIPQITIGGVLILSPDSTHTIGTSLVRPSHVYTDAVTTRSITSPRGSGVDTECFGAAAGNVLTTGARDTFVGSGAGEAVTYGESNTLIGYDAAKTLISGSYNTVLGSGAFQDATTASFNTVVGQSAGQQVITGQENTYIGRGAGYRNSAGNYNTNVGANAGGHGAISYSTQENTYIGYRSGYNCYNGGAGNTAVGFQSANSVQAGSYNVVLGYEAGLGNEYTSSYSFNVFVGRDSGKLATTAQSNVFLGYQTGDSCTTGSSNIVLGPSQDLPAATTSNYLNVGGHLKGYLEDSSVVAWGISGVQLQLDGNTYTDSSTAGSGTAASAAFTSIAQSTLAATNASVTTTNAASLYVAGPPVAGTNQTITTPWAAWIDSGNLRVDGVVDARGPGTGVNNSVIGSGAGAALTTGTENVLIGGDAGSSITAGIRNTFIGYFAGKQCTNAYNVAIGRYAGTSLTSGNSNTLLGTTAGSNLTTGNTNICIGSAVSAPAVDSSNTLNIGNTIKGDLSVLRTDFQGPITFAARTALTLTAGDAITVTKGYHTVQSADASPDDLDTITAGTDGQQVILRRLTASATVTAKDAVDNLQLVGDFAMNGDSDTITLFYDSTLVKWIELSRSDNN